MFQVFKLSRIKRAAAEAVALLVSLAQATNDAEVALSRPREDAPGVTLRAAIKVSRHTVSSCA
jgi:hypothetical protein